MHYRETGNPKHFLDRLEAISPIGAGWSIVSIAMLAIVVMAGLWSRSHQVGTIDLVGALVAVPAVIGVVSMVMALLVGAVSSSGYRPKREAIGEPKLDWNPVRAAKPHRDDNTPSVNFNVLKDTYR